MKFAPRFLLAVCGQALALLLLVVTAHSQSNDPDNPPTGCGCCGCEGPEGIELLANEKKVKSAAGGQDSASADPECEKVAVNPAGEIELKLELASGVDYSHLRVRLRDAKREEVRGTDQFPHTLKTWEWSSPLTVTFECTDEGASGPTICRTYQICWGCDDVCSTCPGGESSLPSGAGEPSGGLGMNHAIQVNVPLGTDAFGNATASLEFEADSGVHGGRGALKLRGWDGLDIGLDLSGQLETVQLKSSLATIEDISSGTDLNAFKITISYDPGNPLATVFRTIVFEYQGLDSFQVSSTFAGKTKLMSWTQIGTNEWTFTEGNGLRRIDQTLTEAGTPVVREVRRKTYEMDPVTSSYVMISDAATKYQMHGGAWARIEEAIDPDGVGLKSTWTYYAPGELTGPSSYSGASRLKSHVRYDGYFEDHYYYEESGKPVHEIELPFWTGTKSRKEVWDGTAKKSTVTETYSSTLIFKEETTYGADTVSRRSYHDAGDYVETVTEYYSAGDGEGRVKKITRADGTITNYTYDENAGMFEVVAETGAESGGVVVDGESRTTVTNADGHVESVLVTAIGAGITPGDFILDHWVATEVDVYGRPTEIELFPTSAQPRTLERTYGCCGLVAETDRFGALTQYDYDNLGRQIRRNQADVTMATVYRGLTVSTHRYQEAVISSVFYVSPDSGDEISREVANLSGTVTESWGPSPESGLLEKMSTTTTTYLNPQGTPASLGNPHAGKREKVELIQVADDGMAVPEQTTYYVKDGRFHSSSGNLQPTTYANVVLDEHDVDGDSTPEVMIHEYRGIYGNGSDQNELSGTFRDISGRLAASYALPRGITWYVYNANGQLMKSSDADEVTTLYGYNARGERVLTVRDSDRDGVIDYGSDQVTRVETGPAYRTVGVSEVEVMRTVTTVWKPGANAMQGTVMSWTDRTPDGERGWSDVLPRLVSTTLVTSGTSAWWLVIDGNGDWEEVSESANGTLRCDYYENTRKMASTRWEAGSTIPASAPTNITSVSTAGFIHGESYYYDILGRVVLTTDSRTGTWVTNQVSPIADEIYQTIDSASRTTWYFYDHRGRLKEVRLPGYSPSGGSANDPLVTFTSYEIDGKVKSVEGGQTYKVEYGYDFARRMTSMTTYGTTTAVTTWSYNQDGHLIQKFYADGPDAGSDPDPGPQYTYTDFGRLKKKIWARGNTTRYDYDNDGRLIRELHFSSGTSQLTVNGASSGNDANTPDHHYGWDALSRRTSVDNGRAVYEYDYDATTLQLSSETIEIDPDGSGGVPAVTRVIERSRDAILRPDGFELKDSSTVVASAGYHYHSGHGRLQGISAGGVPNLSSKSYAWEYAWQAESDRLLDSIEGPVHTVDYTWEASRNVLSALSNTETVGTPTLVSQNTYTVNAIGQRTQVSFGGNVEDSFYGGSGGVPTATDWTYDAKGQVISQDRGSTTTYDRAWKYDGIGNRTKHVFGSSDPNATYPATAGVTQETEFTPNSLNQVTSYELNGASPVSYSYDEDGNLLQGRLYLSSVAQLAWDGRNQLRQTQLNTLSSYKRYYYDSYGRRIAKLTYDLSNVLTEGVLYLYDGWNLIAEYNLSSGSWVLARTYTWGLDLSGTMQGAGGVGGLLAVQVAAGGSGTGPTGNFYVTYDGNGNVEAYLASNGDLQAIYQYDAFGNVFTVSGTPASSSSQGHFFHRFSTKYQDGDTRLLYYGYRYYEPYSGKWTNRDPIGEEGGVNLYGLVGNDGVGNYDVLGLFGPITWETRKAIAMQAARAAGGEEAAKQTEQMYDKEIRNNAPVLVATLSVLVPADEAAIGLAVGGRYFGGVITKVLGKICCSGKTYIGIVIKKILPATDDAARGTERAFWIGNKGLDAAEKSGATIMKASDEALMAARKGNISLLRAEASEFARCARGDTKVFVGDGKGDIFWESELPELLKSVNKGDVRLIYEFVK